MEREIAVLPRLAAPLASFLRTLHSDATAEEIDPEVTLPFDANRRTEMAIRAPWTTQRPDQLLRARVLALFLSAVLALYAHAEEMPALEREALGGLARAA